MFRLILAILIGKTIYFLSRALSLGGGSAAPGFYSLKIDPDLITKLSLQIPQSVVITGTNGKTTTARMISHVLALQNIKVIRNSTGSNLERGIASTLIEQVNIWGHLQNIDLAIWELDEAAFNTAVFKLKPQIIVFLNAFRDQLDRYGEVDTIIKKWLESLGKIDWDLSLVVNSGDANTQSLRVSSERNLNPKIKALSFRVKNHVLWQESSVIFKEGSNKGSQAADFVAEIEKDLGLKGTKIKLTFPKGQFDITIPVPGIYHIYDFLAAFSTLYLLNFPLADINKYLQSFSPAFGRVEKIKLGEKEGFIFLIKNPAGANAVFETINPELKKGDKLLIALNDNFADGTDVSWIWDAQFELIQNSSRAQSRDFQITCSGTRADDLAVRLKYAGADPHQLQTEPNLEKAFQQAKTDLKGRLFILPTYTALLDLQKILTKQKHKTHYWKES